MKRVLFVLLVFVGLTACSNRQNTDSKSVAKTQQKEYIEVLYFHGKQRCVTCNAIENLTKEVLYNDFAEQLKAGKVVLKVIDISTKEGELVADTYEVTWSSLFINVWKDGKEIRNNMTDFGFSYAKGSPAVFKTGVKKRIEELL